MNTIEDKIMNRSLVVVGAVLIQLALGAIYAWSVFTPALKDAGWSKTETQYVFSAGLACFAIVMVIAGRLMPRIGPRKLAISGGIVLGLGYILAGLFGGTSRVLLIVLIGIVGGSGIGLAYVVPIAVGMSWFPDKKGLITGMAVAGFGFGAMFWVKLAGSWGNLLDNLGLNLTFTIYGAAFLAMVVIGGIWMIYPPEGWKPAGWEPPESHNDHGTGRSMDFTSSEMLKTPQFFMILTIFIFSAGAGLMTIGLMKLFPKEALLLADSGLDEKTAGAIAGTSMAVFFSLANGIGRIIWGILSDRIGRKLSVILMAATQGLFMILFQWLAGTPALLYLGSALIGFNFGGTFVLFPTLTADTFGVGNIGQNYGWIFLAYGVGGIFGPILGGVLGDMGNFPIAFTICGILCLTAAVISTVIKSPKKREA
jgi:OFA family oxalate/formate antiporter-like MFS transporter